MMMYIQCHVYYVHIVLFNMPKIILRENTGSAHLTVTIISNWPMMWQATYTTNIYIYIYIYILVV